MKKFLALVFLWATFMTSIFAGETSEEDTIYMGFTMNPYGEIRLINNEDYYAFDTPLDIDMEASKKILPYIENIISGVGINKCTFLEGRPNNQQPAIYDLVVAMKFSRSDMRDMHNNEQNVATITHNHFTDLVQVFLDEEKGMDIRISLTPDYAYSSYADPNPAPASALCEKEKNRLKINRLLSDRLAKEFFEVHKEQKRIDIPQGKRLKIEYAFRGNTYATEAEVLYEAVCKGIQSSEAAGTPITKISRIELFNGINIWFENNELITLAYFFHLDGNICAFDEFEFKNPTGIEVDAECSRRILPLVKDEIKRMIMKPTFLKGRPEGKHEIIVNGESEYTDDLLFIVFNTLNDIDEKSMASCACDIFMMKISEFLEEEKGMPIEISLTSNTLHVSPSDLLSTGMRITPGM